MPRSHHVFRYIPAIALLTLATGCSQMSPTSTDPLGSLPAVAQDSLVQSIDPFAEAIQYATRAANLAQTAQSAAQWDEVSKQWLQAIYWMQSVPPGNPKRAFAQKKVAEYMRYLAYAQQKATVSSRLSYPTFNSDVLDEQLGLYLSYIAAIGRPDVLIVGSSRALQGVDPTMLQQALASRGKSGLKIFNFGVNGATAQVVNFQLQKLLSPQHLPKMILWADGVRAFNSGRVDRTYNEIVRSPGYQRLASGSRPSLTSANTDETVVSDARPTEYLNGASISSPCAFSSVESESIHHSNLPVLHSRFHSAIPQRIHPKSKIQNLTFDPLQVSPEFKSVEWKVATVAANISAIANAIDANGFLPVSKRFNPGSYYQQRPRVAGLYDGDYASFQLGGIQDAALKSVVAFTQARQIPLVVVNLPLTQDYLDSTRRIREQEFRQYMRRGSYQAFLWRDLSTIRGLSRNNYFEDPSHLNQYGAAAVARQLAADRNIPWP